MSTFQIFPNFGRGVIENQIFPKFKIVHIILGGEGSRKLWTFSTICDIFFVNAPLSVHLWLKLNNGSLEFLVAYLFDTFIVSKTHFLQKTMKHP